MDSEKAYDELSYVLLKILKDHNLLNQAIGKLRANIIQNISPVMDSYFERVENIDSISLDSLLCKRSKFSAIIKGEDPTQVILYIPGNKIEANRSLCPVLLFIQECETFTPRSLPIDSEDLRLLISKRFIADGWLKAV
jgi:hypothetical protein